MCQLFSRRVRSRPLVACLKSQSKQICFRCLSLSESKSVFTSGSGSGAALGLATSASRFAQSGAAGRAMLAATAAPAAASKERGGRAQGGGLRLGGVLFGERTQTSVQREG